MPNIANPADYKCVSIEELYSSLHKYCREGFKAEVDFKKPQQKEVIKIIAPCGKIESRITLEDYFKNLKLEIGNSEQIHKLKILDVLLITEFLNSLKEYHSKMFEDTEILSELDDNGFIFYSAEFF